MRVLQSNIYSKIIFNILTILFGAGIGAGISILMTSAIIQAGHTNKLPVGRYNNQKFILCKVNIGNVFANAAPHIDIFYNESALDYFAGANCARDDIFIIRDDEPLINISPLKGNNLSFIKQKEYFLNGILDLAEPKDIITNLSTNDRELILICTNGNITEN